MMEAAVETIRTAMRMIYPSEIREFGLHDRIKIKLGLFPIHVVHEHRFSPRARVDFWLPESGIAIEVKVKVNSLSALIRQAKKYADIEEVRAVIVVSVRPYSLPATLSGKPIFNIALWRQALA